MNLIILKKTDKTIEMLVSYDFDLALITANAAALFDYKTVLEKALKDFMNDHSAAIDRYKPLCDELKAAGVIGYPVTASKDARLYAADRKISIDSELEIRCD